MRSPSTFEIRIETFSSLSHRTVGHNFAHTITPFRLVTFFILFFIRENPSFVLLFPRMKKKRRRERGNTSKRRGKKKKDKIKHKRVEEHDRLRTKETRDNNISRNDIRKLYYVERKRARETLPHFRIFPHKRRDWNNREDRSPRNHPSIIGRSIDPAPIHHHFYRNRNETR